jgi:hypothetical protein
MSRFNIEVLAEDIGLAAEIIANIAEQVRIGVTDSTGVVMEGEGAFMVSHHKDVYDHGDYTDAEGNMVHVHNDAVVSVVWAKGAKSEDFDTPIPVDKWNEDHGNITPYAA